jgi:hypothetical protein
LSEEIAGRSDPAYVDVTPIPGAPSDECFSLVPARVSESGGRLVVGWSIWEWPSLFVEAEFHAVWEAADGSLQDITPKKTPTQRILFLPDPSRSYEGRQMNNVRRAISSDPAVIEFLRASDAEYELMNRGERVHQHGELALAGDEAQEYQSIQMNKAKCFFAMLRLKPTIDAYDPCPCGSGKKVKWCHRN